MKRALSLICVLALMLALPAFASAEAQVSGEITLWSQLTMDELNSYISMYNEINPNVKVNAVSIGSDEYMTKLMATLRAGVNCPDVVLLEIKGLGQIMDTNFLENLSDWGAEDYAKDQVPYVAELSRDSQGNLKGLSYQSCPGGFWYRKDLAREYLGTDDPDEIAGMIDSWDKIAELGAKVHETSGGKTALVDSVISVKATMLMDRTAPYVDQDGKLMSLDFFQNIFATCKNIRDNNADARLNAWTAEWNASFYGSDAFILLGQPSWGLHYCIKANTPSDAADTDDTWGFTYAPTAYQAGGTWASMIATSQNKEAAWDFVRTITVDTDYLLKYVAKNGDMIGYVPAIEQVIANGFHDSFTGNQDIYSYMYKAAMNITAKPYTKYDEYIDTLMNAKIDALLNGQLTLDNVAQSFADELINSYPEVTLAE